MEIRGCPKWHILSTQLTLRREYIHWIFCRRSIILCKSKPAFLFKTLGHIIKCGHCYPHPPSQFLFSLWKFGVINIIFNECILLYIYIYLFHLNTFLTCQLLISIFLRCLSTLSRNLQFSYLKLHLVLSSQYLIISIVNKARSSHFPWKITAYP